MGRPEFSQPGTKGSGESVAVQDRPNIKTIEVNNSETLTSGSSENTRVYAPENAVYRVIAMGYKAPAPPNASSGSHYMYLVSGETALITRGVQNSTDTLQYTRNYWKQSSTADPTTEIAQSNAVQASVADANNGLRFTYSNQSDVDQTETRTIKLVIEERRFG